MYRYGVVPRSPSIRYRNIDHDGETATEKNPAPPTCLHTVLTSSGNAYMNWQTRIMYQTYLKHAAAPGSVMKAFTRVLHRVGLCTLNAVETRSARKRRPVSTRPSLSSGEKLVSKFAFKWVNVCRYNRGKDDELMMEVPTMRFDPNQGKCDTWCDYPVADRSLAIAQWSMTTDSLRCSHVMMVETDYIYVKTAPQSILLPPGQAMVGRCTS